MVLDIPVADPNQKKKNTIIERLGNVWKMFESWDQKRLETYKNSLFFIIVATLIGIYYFLGLKQLGIAILIISLMFLGLILYLEQKLPIEKQNIRRKTHKMDEENKKPEENLDIGMDEDEPKEEKEEPKEESLLGFDSGLPNSEDYNKRMEEAFGTI